MRVWDVHPGYLSRSSLLGQHGEIHALYRVVADKKKGYASHPETMRWRDHLHKLKGVHDLTVREMQIRGFRHHTPLDTGDWAGDQGKLGLVDSLPRQFELLRQKYAAKTGTGRIPLPSGGREFWAQHQYSVLARGAGGWEEMQNYIAGRENHSLSQEGELLELVYGLMGQPVSEAALARTAEQIWTELSVPATTAEGDAYLAWPENDPTGLMAFLFSLAAKYQHQPLLQATIFADI